MSESFSDDPIFRERVRTQLETFRHNLATFSFRAPAKFIPSRKLKPAQVAEVEAYCSKYSKDLVAELAVFAFGEVTKLVVELEDLKRRIREAAASERSATES